MTNLLITSAFAVIGLFLGLLAGYIADCFIVPFVCELQAAMPPLSPEWGAVANNTISNMLIAVDTMPESFTFRIIGSIIGFLGGSITPSVLKM